MKNTIENCEKTLLELIQTKNHMRTIGKLNWPIETVLNKQLCKSSMDLNKLIKHKRKSEPEPAIPGAQPDERIEWDFEL